MHLSGRVVTEAEVEAEITRTRTAFAAFSNVGRVTGGGIVAGLDSTDKVQMALDRLLGVKKAQESGVQAFRGIKDAYMFITGDRDLSFASGGFYRTSQTESAISTSDFPNILLNSMTKRLLQDYAEVGMGGLDQVFTTSPINDYKTQDRVRMGYMGDLPTVLEAGDYVELAKPTDEKISYAVGKVGGLLTISEETIRNDDLGKIAAFPTRLARSGRRTLKQFITTFFSSNPNYDVDTTAWFHSNHGNLGAAVLSAASLNAAELALSKQTEKDSSKRLGLPLSWLMIPVDLKASALQLNNNDDGTNPWFRRFGEPDPATGLPPRIIVNELLTDTNDWYCGCPIADAPCVEIGFLDNVQTPQIYLANQPTVGLMLSNDQIVYKVKMVFGGDIIDYRGAYKAVVA